MKPAITLALTVSMALCSGAAAQGDKPAAAQPSKPAEKPGASPKDGAHAATPSLSPEEQMARAWEAAGKVGPNHRLLKFFEGAWDAEVKDLTPGMETTDKGVMTVTSIRGGRYISMEFEGKSHGKAYEGGGMWGYSNTEKRFEETWADNMSTSVSYLTGSVDKAGKVFTMSGEFTDPVSGKKSRQKEVTTITGKDAFHSEFYMEMGGKETKVMEITYARSKAEKAGGDANKDEKK